MRSELPFVQSARAPSSPVLRDKKVEKKNTSQHKETCVWILCEIDPPGKKKQKKRIDYLLIKKIRVTSGRFAVQQNKTTHIPILKEIEQKSARNEQHAVQV